MPLCRSHDGFTEDDKGYLRPANDKYADQRTVFDDLGNGVLKNAMEGNCNQIDLFTNHASVSIFPFGIVCFNLKKELLLFQFNFTSCGSIISLVTSFMTPCKH